MVMFNIKLGCCLYTGQFLKKITDIKPVQICATHQFFVQKCCVINDC